MTKLRYFMMGYSFSILLITGYLGFHAWKAYVKVKPAISNYQQGNPFSESQKKDMVETLIKVAGFSELIGRGDLQTQIYMNAASILSSSKDPFDKMKTKYFFIKGIEGGELHASKTSEYTPLLEIRLGFATYLLNLGERGLAKIHLQESLEIAERTSEGSAVHKNIKELMSKLP